LKDIYAISNTVTSEGYPAFWEKKYYCAPSNKKVEKKSAQKRGIRSKSGEDLLLVMQFMTIIK